MRREAPPSSDGHLQVTGSAVAMQKGPDGRKRLLEYKAGDYFGELSLLTDAPHAASVECTTDCTCVYLGRCGAPVAKPRPAQPEPKLARRVRPLRQVGIGWIPPPEGWLPPLNDPPPSGRPIFERLLGPVVHILERNAENYSSYADGELVG